MPKPRLVIVLISLLVISAWVYSSLNKSQTFPTLPKAMTNQLQTKPDLNSSFNPSKQSSPTAGTDLPKSYSNEYFNSLTKGEQTIIKASWGEAGLTQYREIVKNEAKAVDVIDISKCEAKPLVAKVIFNSTIIFKNSDSQQHRIVNGTDFAVTIPANYKAEAKLPSYRAINSINGYGCDSKPTGIFWVAE